MISINDFTKGFERENLLEKVNTTIQTGDKIALIGNNGTGKTTFLKCLVGQEDFQGQIETSDIKISLMEQERTFDNLDKSFNNYIKEKKKLQEEKIKNLEIKLGESEICENEEKFNSTINKYNLLIKTSTLDLENKKLVRILEELKIDRKILNQKISELSGGQKVKLRLAECIAKDSDIYLFDEPTNHLDLESTEWLEQYIKQNIKTLIAISHDRYFLEKISNKEWEIENKTLKKYTGSYNEYEKQKEIHVEILRKTYKDLTKKKEELLKSAEEKYRWMQKNKSPRLKALGDRLKRDAEKINPGPDPDEFNLDININFSSKFLHNCEVFRLISLAKKFGSKIILENITKNIDNGEKIALIGNNGTGKTTLLKLLAGEESPTSGAIKKRPNLKIGYFDQELSDINQEQTIVEFMEKQTSKNDQHIISILLKFGFKKEIFNKKIKQLSGGEKGRLNILRITQENNEVLFLDEPTNNLDIKLKESLAKALASFPGTVIFVSHDRHFIDSVATRIFEIKNRKINSHIGNYSDYLEFCCVAQL